MEKENRSFEEKIKELEELIKKLENGDIPLDEAVATFTKANNLALLCDSDLKKAEKALTKLVKDDGTLEDFADVKE